jgi:hypothetical protein
MRSLLLTLIVVAAPAIIYCQNVPRPLWKVGISGGWGRTTTSDLMLNHYKYSGDSFLNLNLHGSLYKMKHGFHFQLAFNKATLNPGNIRDIYYDYNYSDRSMAELTISYLYTVLKYRRHFQISVGGCNASLYSVQHEFHRNLLYPYGLGHRKAFVASPVTLMPLVSLDYTFEKTALNAVFGYGIANVSARPDDNYVKQIGMDHGRHWNLYFPNKFSGFRYSLRYQYTYRKIAATIGYEVLYNSIDEVAGFKSLQKMILTGIVISR